MADDNLIQAALGALSGFSSIYVPRKQAEYEHQLKRQDLQDQLSIYPQQLAMQSRSQIATKEAEQPFNVAAKNEELATQYGLQSKLETQKANETIQIYDPKSGTYVTVPKNSKVLPWQKTEKPEDRKVSDAYPPGIPRPKEITSDMDNLSIGEAQKLIQSRALAQTNQQKNETSAGKTGIFQGMRNSLFGTPGLNAPQSAGLPLVPQNQGDGLPQVGSNFSGSKVLKVVKVK